MRFCHALLLLGVCATSTLAEEAPRDWTAFAQSVAAAFTPPREVRWERANVEANSNGVLHARGVRMTFSGDLEVLYQRFPRANWAERESHPLRCRTPTVLQIRGNDLLIVRGAEVAEQAAGVRALSAVWSAVGNADVTHKIVLRPLGQDTTQRATYTTEACPKSFRSLYGKAGYVERQEPVRDGIWRERVSDNVVRTAQGSSREGMDAMKAYVQAVLDSGTSKLPNMPLGKPGLAQQVELGWEPKRSKAGNFVVELVDFPKSVFVRRLLFSRPGSNSRVERVEVTDDEPLTLAPLPVGEWVLRMRVDGEGRESYFRRNLSQAKDGKPLTVVFNWKDRLFKAALE